MYIKLKALLENYSLYTRQVHISFVFLWLRETATVGTNYHHPRSLIEASWGIWSFLTQLTKSNHVLRRRRRNRMLPSESGIGGKYAVIYCRDLRIGGGSGRLLSSSKVFAESSSSLSSLVDPVSTYVSSELDVEVSEAGERSRRLILKLGSLTRRPLLARCILRAARAEFILAIHLSCAIVGPSAKLAKSICNRFLSSGMSMSSSVCRSVVTFRSICSCCWRDLPSAL